jgi:hypothetical protein
MPTLELNLVTGKNIKHHQNMRNKPLASPPVAWWWQSTMLRVGRPNQICHCSGICTFVWLIKTTRTQQLKETTHPPLSVNWMSQTTVDDERMSREKDMPATSWWIQCCKLMKVGYVIEERSRRKSRKSIGLLSCSMCYKKKACNFCGKSMSYKFNQFHSQKYKNDPP